jgi:DNA helicase HerA-like ATPase
MRSDATYIGFVTRVVGAKLIVTVSPDLPSTSPIVAGRMYRIGQVGTFVRIPVGFTNVYGVVSTVGSVERPDEGGGAELALRTLEVHLVGEASPGSAFQRGLSEYPTLDDEVHVVSDGDLALIYQLGGHSQITIGTHSASESLPARLDLDRLVTRHAAILGSTGSGKSNSVAALLKAITEGEFPSARLFVIDPHGEYGAAFEGRSRVFKIGSEQFPLLIPYWALGFDELAWFLVDRKSAAESPQDATLRDKIYELRKEQVPRAKANQGRNVTGEDITVDSPVHFSVKRLWYDLDRLERQTFADAARTQEALIEEGNADILKAARFRPAAMGAAAPFKAAPPPIMAGYVNKILTRLKDRRFDFLLRSDAYDGETRDLDDLVREWAEHEHAITVFDLAGVPAEVTDLVVGALSRILFETMFWGRDLPGVGRERPLLTVFEEAHLYLPSGEGRFLQGYARRVVQRILKEGRKYGFGAVVVSQRPSEVDETILSQCGTFIALRLTNSNDQARVRSAVPDELPGLTSLLPILRTGEAVIVGEATQIPIRARIHLVEPRPASADPLVSQRWLEARGGQADYSGAITSWRLQR